jgi:hypothetical protein
MFLCGCVKLSRANEKLKKNAASGIEAAFNNNLKSSF